MKSGILTKSTSLTLLLLVMFLMVSCVSQRNSGGMSAPKRKNHRKCDCPKWTRQELMIHKEIQYG